MALLSSSSSQQSSLLLSSSSPYAPAAKILNEIWTKRKGLKTVVYSSRGELTCNKTTYAQCCHVLEYQSTLDRLVKEVPSVQQQQVKNRGLLYVLLYELLLGPNQRIRGGGTLKRLLVTHQKALQKKLEQIQAEDNHPQPTSWRSSSSSSSSNSSSSNSIIPRYVRINTLVATDRETLLRQLRKKIDTIYIDPIVPDLLVVAPTPENRASLQEFVASHQIILQDKSSCFSALCLVHGYYDYEDEDNYDCKGNMIDGDVLDACAAPGNKTSHLAALIQQQEDRLHEGTNHVDTSKAPIIIHALDKSHDRYKLLKRRMTELVPNQMVRCYNMDFLETTATLANSKTTNRKTKNKTDHSIATTASDRFCNIRAILLDPSCSGSGMTTNHTEQSLNRDPYYVDERIQSLSDFQFHALNHATTKFPNVDRVVYSTCSRYYQENEGVIKRLLDAKNGEWTLIAPRCLHSWHRRGLLAKNDKDSLTEEQAKCLIRVDPEHDATNGFFVACLQRTKSKIKMKRKQQSPMWISPAASCPEDMELYHNQFHVSGQTHHDTSYQSHSTTKLTQRNKRKTTTDQILCPPSPSSHDDGPPNKKRAKKLAWKRQQRLKKEARLQHKKAEQK